MKTTWLDADETKTVLELKVNADPTEVARAMEILKNDYHDACKLIAQMHGAAVGKFGDGPKRGIVEDVEDLRTELIGLQEENAELKKQLVQALRHVSSLQDTITFEGAAGIASIKKRLGS